MTVSRIGKRSAVAAGTVILAIIVWGTAARAFNPQPEPPGFGTIGISYGQTLRLNVLNAGGVLSGFPPGPCRATLELFDNSTGRTSLALQGASLETDLR